MYYLCYVVHHMFVRYLIELFAGKIWKEYIRMKIDFDIALVVGCEHSGFPRS